MDKEMIAAKLESLRKCLERIQGKVPIKKENLLIDIDLQDIIAVNLERAVQLCVDIACHFIADSGAEVPGTMAGTFPKLLELDIISASLAERMVKAVGFRNIAVHNYNSISYEIVYSICTHNLEEFKDFARCVAKHAGLSK